MQLEVRAWAYRGYLGPSFGHVPPVELYMEKNSAKLNCISIN